MSGLALAAALCALAYLPLAARPPGFWRSAFKTASVGLLALAAVLTQAPMLLVLALSLCALGDWLLSRAGQGAFIAGIGAFAAGHLAYISLFVTDPRADLLRISQPPQLWLALILAAAGGAAVAILAPRAGDLRGPVLAYIPVILGMGGAALALPAQGALAIALPAALAFIVSDLVLAAEQFLLPEGNRARRYTPYIVWPLYWLAQAGFLTAFA